MAGHINAQTGKTLKLGYTTGSCATAAAKAAFLTLTKGPCDEVAITLPDGSFLTIPVKTQQSGENSALGTGVKDSGDDADVTHGIEIIVKVTLTKEVGKIVVKGGQGVGVVTKPGLQIPVGQAAINPVPQQMIRDNLRPLLPKDKGIEVLITVPEGEKIAKKTFNARLGIEGGISIIGTSGRVRPMSDEAYMDAIFVELKQKKTMGIDRIVLVPGMHGENYATKYLDIVTEEVVHMGNYVGFTLNACQQLGFAEILLVGHIGKLVKLAGGIFNTLGRVADAKAEIVMAHLALLEAPTNLIKEIYKANTTDEMSDLLFQASYEKVFEPISIACKRKCLAAFQSDTNLNVVLYDMKLRKLADTRPKRGGIQ